MTVSVIVPVYNRAQLLPGLIRCLECQTVPVEIIIVDDGSTDNPREFLPTTSAIFLRQSNQGPAAARNFGACHATGEILAFTDSDCRPSPDWIEQLLGGFETTEIGAVAGTYTLGNPENLLARLIQAEIAWRHRKFGPFIRAFGSYNVAIRREVFFQLGGFDPSFRMASGEDNDLSYRLLKAGFTIRFAKEARVQHLHPQSLIAYLRQQYLHGQWRARLYAIHPQMVTGDDYTNLKDLIEIALCGATLTWPALNAIAKRRTCASMIGIFLGLLWLGIELPPAISIAFHEKNPETLLLAPLAISRAFFRWAGLLKGLISPPWRGQALPSTQLAIKLKTH